MESAPLPEGTVRVTMGLPARLVDSVRHLAAREGVPEAEWIRRAVEREIYLREAETRGEKLLLEDPKGNFREMVRR